MVINGVNINTLFPNKVQFLDYSDHAPTVTRTVVNADNDYKLLGAKVKVGIRNMGSGDVFLWTLSLQVLETYGASVFQTSTNGTIVLNNSNATYITPLKITITPTANIASFSIYGMLGYTAGSPLTITDITNGKKVIIYGREKLVLEETSPGVWINKFLDTNISLFPQIAGGASTTLTFTPTSNVTVRVDFNPVYI
jgi:hypothetical protein